mgnify:CR=1 FL=1
MKLPRDLSGDDLARRLGRYGYERTRQTGSHVRLTRKADDREHHITIPLHDPLKAGTLSSILNDVAGALAKTRETLMDDLFGCR